MRHAFETNSAFEIARKIFIRCVGCALLLLPVRDAVAQQNDTLIASIQEAVKAGLSETEMVKVAQAEIGRAKALRKSGFNPEKTDLNFMVGQYNSSETDFAFSVHQNIAFPKVYAVQGKLHDIALETRETQLDVVEHELSRSIKKAWQTLVYLAAKEELLYYKDSLLKAVNDQIKGDSELDSLLLVGHRDDLNNELKVLQTDLDIAKRQLNAIIDRNQPLTFLLPPLEKRNMDVSGMTGSLVVNPTVVAAHKEIEMSIAQVDLEKAKMMPGLKFGYFNRSMIGENTVSGAVATGTNRFSGITAGLSIPLFYSANKAQISAAKMTRSATEARVRYFQEANIAQIDRATSEMSKFDQSMEYYETQAVPRANQLLSLAEKALQNGEINLDSYIRHLERVIEVKATHLKTIDDYNQAVIELEYALGI